MNITTTADLANAVERNTYRDRFPGVPDEWQWPTREQDDALIAGANTERTNR